MTDSDVVERDELVHEYPGMPLMDFLQRIDDTGGWPLGYTHVSFYHSTLNSGRVCIFGMRDLREPYWTTVCTSDDYYYWKLSESKKRELLKKARRQLIGQLT